jgi:adenosylcobinamide-GDP ribazoletransferase
VVRSDCSAEGLTLDPQLRLEKNGVVRRALAFLTVFGRGAQPTSRTLTWFPLVGAVIGAIVGGSWWLAARVWPAAVAAVVAVGVDAAITGAMQLEGLAHTMDGLIPSADRARRLEIMADRRIGAFGSVALLLVLALRIVTLSATTSRPLAVIALWIGSRTLMAVIASTVSNAHEAQIPGGGAPSSFVRDSSTSASVISAYGLALATACAVLGFGSRGIAMLGAEVIVALAVTWLAVRRLGGYTGEVLGAAGVLGETAGLLALVAR